MEEKRKFIRIAAPLVVVYKSVGKTFASKKTIAKDFSEDGIRFPVYEKLKVGAPLELHIELPFDTIPIFAKGRVVWSKALSSEEGSEIYDAGVQFTQMQAFDRKRLTQAARRFLSMGRKYRSG